MLVYVLNISGSPLMPCSAAKARKLLQEKKARVVSRTPFVIKLLHGSSGYKQVVILGQDAGAKNVGVAAIGNGKVLYAAEVKLRTDVHEKMQQRSSYRRTRRSRKLRYRAARFNNRGRKVGWLTPTLRSKVQAHEREIKFVKSILPISKVIIETASFDIHKITNPDVKRADYQKGRQLGFYNVKSFILNRDKYDCQKCLGKKKCEKLHIHHILFRSNGGTDSPENLVVLCEICHNELHAKPEAQKESHKLTKKRRANTTDATQVSTVSSALRTSKTIGSFEETFGYITKFNREITGLSKTHYNDAITIASQGELVKTPDNYIQKVCVARGDYRQTNGVRSEQKNPTGKIMGFMKFDKVEWIGKEYFIKGRMSSGYAILMGIDFKKIDLKPIPKFKTMKRISARKSCLIIQIIIENSRSNTMSSLYVNIGGKF